MEPFNLNNYQLFMLHYSYAQIIGLSSPNGETESILEEELMDELESEIRRRGFEDSLDLSKELDHPMSHENRNYHQ